MASNNGPSLYDPARAAEMAAFNAGLTQAGSKHFPGRGLKGRGGTAMNTGVSTHNSPGRPAPSSNTRTQTGSTILGNHVVGSRTLTAGAAAHGRHSQMADRTLHASPTSGSNPWAGGLPASNTQPVSNSIVNKSPLHREIAITPLRSQITHPLHAPAVCGRPSLIGLSSPNARQPQGLDGNALIRMGMNSSAGALSAGAVQSASLAMPPPPIPAFQTVNEVNCVQPAAVPTRQQIVTNWGPDPVGPRIPAHLRQTSASAAIAEMAELIGMKYEELTTDGMTIPAPRPRKFSQQQRTPSGDVVMSTSNPPVQENVYSAAWMEAKKSGHRHTSSEMDVDTDEDTAVAVTEATRGSGNLQDSRWNESMWDLPFKRQAPSEHAPTAPFGQGTAAVHISESPRTIAFGGLKDSKFANPSTNGSTHQSGPLRSVSNGLSSSQTFVPVPNLSASHAHYEYNSNSLGQTRSPFQTQSSFDCQNVAPSSNPFAVVKSPYANTPAYGTFLFGAAKSSKSASTTAVTVSTNTAKRVPAAKTEKTLKDSMWA